MRTLSIDYAHKLLSIRKAENLTQKQFADLTDVSLSTIKKYETGQQPAGAAIAERVVNCPPLQKYTLWLMTGKVAPEANQVAPAIDEQMGQEKTIFPFT